MQEFTLTNEMILLLIARVIVATLCGMLIGWEREKRLKSAGLRTHMLVSWMWSTFLQYRWMPPVWHRE